MSKSKFSTALILLTLLIAFGGCTVYNDISTKRDPDTDFGKYHSFAWLQDKADTLNRPYNNEVIRNNIRNYFGQSLAERGYLVNLDSPDVLLQLVIVSVKKQATVFVQHPQPYYYRKYYYGSTWYFPYHQDYYYRRSYDYCVPPECTVEKICYIESSITLHVIDRKQNKLVWTGTAKGDIYDPGYINRSIHPAVEAIMKQFPVPEFKPGKRDRGSRDDIYN
jgi:hypothetical protein